jgi:hypothetical protein
LARLEGLRKLRRLDLSGTEVGASGAPTLAKYSQLQALRLWNCEQAGDEAAAALRQLGGLQTLDLAKTALGDAGLNALSGMPSLRKLYVGETKVTPEAVAAFRKANPGVEVSWTPPAPEIERKKNVAP